MSSILVGTTKSTQRVLFSFKIGVPSHFGNKSISYCIYQSKPFGYLFGYLFCFYKLVTELVVIR
jgi:hypothetical protein